MKRKMIALLQCALVLTVLCMSVGMPAIAAEIGTQELITNGGFTLTEGVPEGWGIIFGSNVTWDQIAVLDSTETGDGHIDLSCINGVIHDKPYGVGLTVQTNPGDSWLLTFDYKAQGEVRFQIQGNYGSTSLPEGVTDGDAFPTKTTAFTETMAATTGDGYTRATVLIPAYTTTYEGIEYKADRVGLYLRNVANLYYTKGAEAAEGTMLQLDNVSIRSYRDEALVKNGDFTLGSTNWKIEAGKVVFEDGVLKITDKASANWVSTTCVLNEELLPDGITHMRYRLSFKYKAFNTETSEAVNIGSASIGMSYTYDKTTDVDIHQTYLMRNPSATYTRPLEDGWTECVYYTRNSGSSKVSNISYATTPATATAFGVQLRGVGDGATIWYDDVVVTPLPYAIEKVTGSSNVECTSISAGDRIIISGVAANKTAAEVTPQMYIAFYSEGTGGRTLLSVETAATVSMVNKVVTAVDAETGAETVTYRAEAHETLPANRSGIITSSEITVPAANAGETLSMKAYVWSGTGLVPLGGAYTLGEAVSAS